MLTCKFNGRAHTLGRMVTCKFNGNAHTLGVGIGMGGWGMGGLTDYRGAVDKSGLAPVPPLRVCRCLGSSCLCYGSPHHSNLCDEIPMLCRMKWNIITFLYHNKYEINSISFRKLSTIHTKSYQNITAILTVFLTPSIILCLFEFRNISIQLLHERETLKSTPVTIFALFIFVTWKKDNLPVISYLAKKWSLTIFNTHFFTMHSPPVWLLQQKNLPRSSATINSIWGDLASADCLWRIANNPPSKRKTTSLMTMLERCTHGTAVGMAG